MLSSRSMGVLPGWSRPFGGRFRQVG